MQNGTRDFSRRIARVLTCAALVGSTLGVAAPAAAREHDKGCDDCGTVVTTNRRDERGSATAGTVVGGVGGALAGNVIGHNTTSTVLGGVGGAVAGNLIGRNIGSKKIWSVKVRMDRGGTRDVDFTSDPHMHQGQRVRVGDGTLSRM